MANRTPRARWQRRPLLVALLGLLGCALAFFALQHFRVAPGPGACELVSTVDGDTLVLRVAGETGKLRVRLLGVDCPELGSSAGFRAALFSAEQLEQAREIRLLPGDSRARPWPEDKYGRLLCRVSYIDTQGTNRELGAELLNRGLAEVYK